MGMFQTFFLKQMLKSKMKGVPPAEQERILGMIEKNPDFFKMIGEEVEKRKKSGKSEMEATMEVMREHQADFQKLMK
jgi:hypothetical protein